MLSKSESSGCPGRKGASTSVKNPNSNASGEETTTSVGCGISPRDKRASFYNPVAIFQLCSVFVGPDVTARHRSLFPVSRGAHRLTAFGEP